MEDFTIPTPEQVEAWQDFNAALGKLATSYAVDSDVLNEMAGILTETSIKMLQKGQP